MSILIRTCAVLLLALVGLPQRESTAQTSILRAPDIHVLRAASLSLAHRSRAEAIRWLQRQPEVASADLAVDGKTIEIDFRDGSQSSILPREMMTVPVHLPTFRSYVRPHMATHDVDRRALVMEPFATEQLGPSAGVAQVRNLTTSGLQVTTLYDKQVTIESMKTLSNYAVVYIHTHGGVNRGEAVIESGQEVTGDDPQMDEMIKNFEVFVTGIAGSDKIYYGILSRFILHYLGQFPENSMMFVNTCSLLKAYLFWKALQIKGLSTLVSYDEEPILPDALYAGDRFFDSLGQGMSVSQAMAAAQAGHYDTSTYLDVEAHLGYLGDGLVTLQGRSDGPLAATPYPTPDIPTATPGILPPPPPGGAPPPGGPTPTSTPTPLPPPPLQVNLRSNVAPGSEQAITVQSHPGVNVTIQVSYPNGDHLPATERVTGDDGTATYAYVQAGNKILPNRYTAEVLVTASDGETLATVTKMYRIGFGRVDISIAPLLQSSAKFVTIWVHTRAHTTVKVSLYRTRTQIGQLKMRTNAQGWGHGDYIPSSPRVLPSHSPIVVQAWAQSGRATYSVRTTFVTP